MNNQTDAWDPTEPIRLIKERNLSDPESTVRNARLLLEEVSFRAISLGERMILRRYVLESMDDLRRCNRFFDLFEPHVEAVSRYLHTFPEEPNYFPTITS